MAVSIIIPLYNKARHVRRAIDSVLAQTRADFELIVVDDGSTDGGAEIVEQVDDPRVRLIRQQNAGANAARKKGVAEAKSDLVAFLDADDEWYPDFLETVLVLRDNFPQAAVWGTGYARMFPQGELADIPLDDDIRRQTDGLPLNYFRAAAGHVQPIGFSSMLVSKEKLLKSGGFSLNLVRYHDPELLFRIALRYPIAYNPQTKAICHLEADNRSDQWRYSGNPPFFACAMNYLEECGDGREELGKDAIQYIARRHTDTFADNWLAGNAEAIREIVRDCGHISGYRLKCRLWKVLSYLPSPLVRCLWWIRRKMQGRDTVLPAFRSVYYETQESDTLASDRATNFARSAHDSD